jgi:paraquat-inducible protein B
MTSTDNEDSMDLPQAKITEKRSSISMIWLTPLIAALIGGWLIFEHFKEQGVIISVDFKRASGIEAGKTQVKFKDIQVGMVKDVQFSDALDRVIVTMEIQSKLESRLTKSSQFWVVRPRIGAGGISGLSTILSGAYVAIDPGAEGKPVKSFTGLEEPPGFVSDSPGSIYQLRSENLGSLSLESPVYYRDIQVGKVVSYDFSDDGRHVDIDIFIDAPYDRFVSGNSRFWNTSGVDIDLDSEGVKLDVPSLLSLIAGGISFTTPQDLETYTKAPAGMLFTLHEEKEQTRTEISTLTVPIVLYFDDTVRGLSIDAPVEYRGIRIGTVKSISFEGDDIENEIRIPVLVELEPDRIPGNTRKTTYSSDEERIQAIARLLDNLVQKGLRAKLQRGSLITGQIFVELDMYPDEPPTKLAFEKGYMVLPTVPNTVNLLTRRIDRILAKLEEVPVADISEHLKNTLAGTDALVNDENSLPASIDKMNRGLEQLDHLLTNMNKGPINTQVLQTLQELEATARSLRIMAEYLERHPEALIKGKK